VTINTIKYQLQRDSHKVVDRALTLDESILPKIKIDISRGLDFYPSNLGSTPARVPTTKKIKIKKNIKAAQCAFNND